MPAEATWPLILLPGIGTNAQVFALQRTAFPQLIVPPWLPPERSETLECYAARMAQRLNLAGPCLVGGMSFGGMVALEMTRHMDARGCILISSLRSSTELPVWARVLGPCARLLPPRIDRVISGVGWLTLKTMGPILPPRAKGLCVHFSKTRSALLPWACCAATGWRSASDNWPCPVFQLHGDADPLFPHRRTQADRLVPRGGHVLPLTHPFVVNAFIDDCLRQVGASIDVPSVSATH